MSPASSKKSKDPLDTPIMRQYLALKEEHPDAILFFRMGDFYELFLEDAEVAAPIMDVALTQRQSQIPMCGVPYHSATTYLSRLVEAGKRVAIAEQKSDPANPKLMKRAVVRVLTPGTLIEEGLLEGSDRNYLCALVLSGDSLATGSLGVALADIATGDFVCRSLLAEEAPSLASDESSSLLERVEEPNLLEPYLRQLRDLVYRYDPQEFLLSSDLSGFLESLFGASIQSRVSYLEPWKASPTEGRRRIEALFATNLRGLGFSDDETDAGALGAVSLVLHYIKKTFPEGEIRISPPRFERSEGEFMALDEATIRNLDLVHNQEEGGQGRTLFGVLNFCKTAPGRRALRESILSPSTSLGVIQRRQERLAALLESEALCRELGERLSRVHDLERTLVRMSAGRALPRDLGGVRSTIESALSIHLTLARHDETREEDTGGISKREPLSIPKELRSGKENQKFSYKTLLEVPSSLRELLETLQEHLADELPVKLGSGELLASGVDAGLDEAREARDNGGRLIAEFESTERERHGLPNLRVKYNRVAGYFIEISKAQAKDAPSEYKRRQTLVNAERFTCERLAALEERLLAAEATIAEIEERYFSRLTELVLKSHEELRILMHSLARLDLLLSLAQAARRYDWVRPDLSRERYLHIIQGRHPVVEAFLPSGEVFIGNDLFLNGSDRQLAIITGPNMAGKSTYIRQVALIQILAQMGSWVPAAEFSGSVMDRVFTRIGAHDNLTRGESTFFVEMLEAARILNQCTDRSLVIMDEVGRGTSTYDGISLARAILEYLTAKTPAPGVRPLCLFATHYHELTKLDELPGVFNLTMEVEEISGRVLFLHSVREGAADRSYGIHVARLAGMPQWVVQRAEALLSELSELEGSSESTSEKDTKAKEATDRGAEDAPNDSRNQKIHRSQTSQRSRGQSSSNDTAQLSLFE